MSLEENHRDDDKREHLARQSNKHLEQCCGSNGLCSHEVLQDKEADSVSKVIPDKYMRKVPFLLVLLIIFCFTILAQFLALFPSLI